MTILKEKGAYRCDMIAPAIDVDVVAYFKIGGYVACTYPV